MLSLLAIYPLALLVPALVLATWLSLWINGRRTGVKFFLSAAAVAVLSIPASLLVEVVQGPCYNPTHETWACGDAGPFLTGILSAIVTAGCVVGLLLLTAFLKVFGLGPTVRDPTHAERHRS